MKTLGVHYLLELAGCPAELLDDVDFVRTTLLEAARQAQAHIVSEKFNLFNPHGISGFLVIAESHLSIHTWPERNYAAVDIFTCGHFELAEIAMEFVANAFKPTKSFIYKIKRGIFNEFNNELETSEPEAVRNCHLNDDCASHILHPDGFLHKAACC